MDILQDLAKWYTSQCNGEWEHSCCVKIDTLDNPGWIVTIDLKGTPLERRTFAELSDGLGQDNQPESKNWISCRITEQQFIGAGDPDRLIQILTIFLQWANNSE